MAQNSASFRSVEESSAIFSPAAAASAELRHSPLAFAHPIPASVGEELFVAVERAASRSVRSMNALQVAVQRFTIALRDEGATPEAVLISLKGVINSRAFPMLEGTDATISVDALRHQISTWSIEEFFREKKA